MLGRTWRLLCARATPGVALGLLVAIVLFQWFSFKPRTQQLQMGLTDPTDVCDPILDSRAGGYGPEAVGRLFGAWQPWQRECYRVTQLREDLVFPWVYGTWLAVLLAIAFRGTVGGRDRGRLLLLPLAAVVADYAENLTIALVLLPAGDTLPAWAVYLACWFTWVKFAAILVSLGAVVVGADWSGRRALLLGVP